MKSLYSEFNAALSILNGVKDVDYDDKMKILFNIVAKHHEQFPDKIKHSIQPKINGESYTFYQDFILIGYNRELSARFLISKHDDPEHGEQMTAFISNNILGLTAFGSQKFEHYFSTIRFYLDNEPSIFPCDDNFGFLHCADEFEEFANYLQELLNHNAFYDDVAEIVRKVIRETYDSLRPHERIEFIDNVLDIHYIEECQLCGNRIPWCEMLDATYIGDGYCSRCRHILDKDD